MPVWTIEKRRNISELSFEKDLTKFSKSLKEWVIDSKFYLNQVGDSVCELCGKTGLVYEYFIKNEINKSEMLVGSECIYLFFENIDFIKVWQNSSKKETRNINKNETKKLLNLFFKIHILKQIESATKDNFIHDICEEIREEGSLTFKQSLWFLHSVDKIFSFKSEKDRINFLKRVSKTFTTKMRKEYHKDQLYEMANVKFKHLRKYAEFCLNKKFLEEFDSYYI